MKLNTKQLLFVLGIVLVTGFLVWLFGGQGRRISWLEHYDRESRDPYGVNVIFQLLESYFPGQETHILQDSFALPAGKVPANYLFIGAGLFFDTTSVDKLLRFVAAGNTAFIASRTLPAELMEKLMPEITCGDDIFYWDDYSELVDSSVFFQLYSPRALASKAFPFRFWRYGEVRLYRWQYIDNALLCDSDPRLTALGVMNDTSCNFVRMAYGDGFFLLHTAPIAFSNIQLLEKSALRYADGVFSHLPPGAIYWDEYSKVSEEIARRRNQASYFGSEERRLDTQSPLRYVLSQPALTWAWYLLLTLGLLYLLFRAKRRQRIIPVLEPNANTSLEFLNTIGRLYFLQNDHRGLSIQQMKLFLAYVRRHYAFPSRDLDDDFVEKLAGKSEIPANRIRELINRYREIERSSRITSGTLIEFHRQVAYFYKHCK